MNEIPIKINLDVNGQVVNIGEVIVPVVQTNNISSVDKKLVYTSRELAEKLCSYEEKVNKLRSVGILKGIKMGKGYVYTYKEVDEFLELYHGMDLSTDKAILDSINKVFENKNKKSSTLEK